MKATQHHDKPEEVVVEETDENETNFIKAVEAHEVNSECSFTCQSCELSFNSKRGLQTHKGKKHKNASVPIPQLDGLQDDLNVALKYTFVSWFHEEDVKYTLKEIFLEDVCIVSRVKVGEPRSADYLWMIEVKMPWPNMSADQTQIFKDIQQKRHVIFLPDMGEVSPHTRTLLS